MLKNEALNASLLLFLALAPLSLVSMDRRQPSQKPSSSSSSSSSSSLGSSKSIGLLPNPVLPRYVYNAARYGGPDNYRTIQTFIENFSYLINAPYLDQRNNTMLHVAALNNHLDIIELLLDEGADVNAQTHDGQTPLIAAAQRGNRDAIRLILDRHADAILQHDHEGRTALMAAVVNADIDTIGLLIGRGAIVNARTNAGATALNMANDRGNQQIIKYLLSKGAKTFPLGTPNRPYRSSAEMRAAQEARKSAKQNSPQENTRKDKEPAESEIEVPAPVCEDAAPALQEIQLRREAEQAAERQREEEARKAEELRQQQEAEKRQRQEQEEKEHREYEAAQAEAHRREQEAARQAAEVDNMIQTQLNRELHDAVERNNRADTLRALGNGADINNLIDGQTALHRASQNGYLALIEFLLEHGASRVIRNTAGLIPEQVARNLDAHRLFINHYWAARNVRNVLQYLDIFNN